MSVKLAFLKKVKENNYKADLYFIATENPEINIARVKTRIAQRGHSVNTEIIRERYFRSFENLKSAVPLSNRAFVFDNSCEIIRLISEISGGYQIKEIDKEMLPN